MKKRTIVVCVSWIVISLILNIWFIVIPIMLICLYLNRPKEDSNKARKIEIRKYTSSSETEPRRNQIPKNGILNTSKHPPNPMPEEFTMLDVETTGLNEYSDEIIEISLIKYRNGEEIDSYHTLLKPKASIPEEATRVNNISNEMVRNAPKIGDLIEIIYDHFKDAEYIVGYNVTFDLKFIGVAFGKYDKIVEEVKYIDVLEAVRVNVTDLPNKKLETVKNYFGIQHGSHRAASDCQTTFEVWKRTLEIAEEKRANRKIELQELFSFLNENEQKFITALEESLPDGDNELSYRVMSDKVIDFTINGLPIGRVKLSGRKYKMQIRSHGSAIWLDIESLDEALLNIKHWTKYTQKILKTG